MSTSGSDERLVDPTRLFVLSGPSGVGKNTVAEKLCEQGRAVRAVTATTRPPKPGEVDGSDYHFVSEVCFRRWIGEGRLVEFTRYVGHYYGTPAASVNQAAASGLPVLLTIDVDGGLEIKRKWPEATLVFLEPPCEAELRRRLRGRARDAAEDIEDRIGRAREEMAYAERYDCRVVNGQLETAVGEVAAIIEQVLKSNKTVPDV
jgi:guanylate kinase